MKGIPTSWQSGRADAEVQMPYQSRSALVLSEAERDELEGWARQHRTAQSLALRARIVLRSGDGLSLGWAGSTQVELP